MSFNANGLTPIGGQSRHGQAPGRFAYKTADALAVVLAAGYIPATHAGLFALGDKIDVVVVDNLAAPTQVLATGELLVANIASSVVSLVNVTDKNIGANRYIRVPFFFNQTDLLAGTSQRVLSPVAGSIARIVAVVKKQVTTGGAIGLSLAGAAVAGLSITVADAAAVGTVQTATPTAVQRVTEDQAVEITAAAAFASAGEVFGYVEIAPDIPTDDIFIPFSINQTDLLAATSQWVPAPVAGQIVKAATIAQVGVTTGGPITIEIATVAVAGLQVDVADAAAAGDVDSDEIAADVATAAVAAEQAIEIIPGTLFATAGALNGYIRLRPTVPTEAQFLWFFANQTDLLAATPHYGVAPVAGWITRAVTAAQVGVTTGGPVTVEVGGVPVDGLSVTVADSASAGDIDRDNGAFHDITSRVGERGAVEVVFGTAFATAGALNGFVEVLPLDAVS